MKESIARAAARILQRRGRPGLASGMEVSSIGALKVEGDIATLSLSSGARHDIRVSTAAGGIVVRTTSHVSDGSHPLVEVREFPVLQAQDAREHFERTVRQWRATLHGQGAAVGLAGRSGVSGGSLLGRAGWFGAGAAASAIALVTFGMLISPPASVAQGQPQAQDPAAAAALQLAQLTEQAERRRQRQQAEQARLSDEEKSRLAAASRVEIRRGKQSLVAFSDPKCPACQDLEKETSRMSPDVGVVIVPVGFQPGSRELSAQVLCSAEPRQAWAQAMRGEALKAPACDKGLQQVDRNNDLFISIGASATPTIVAPNGQLAQGAAPAESLRDFVSAHASN